MATEAQGQTMYLYLKTTCFPRGQFYVGCSRAGFPRNPFIFGLDLTRTKKYFVAASAKTCEAYKAYFGMPIGDQDKFWAPHFTCEHCKETLQDCTYLGFYNATLNACGYCVEGMTGLEKDYGKDCRGVCGGFATIDCTNTCAGHAYVDECTGKCVGGTSSGKEDNNHRDCRGLCLSSSKLEYRNDICGVCSIASGTFSLFWDCTNTCLLPGDHKPKAQLLCGQCVNGKSNVSSSEVLDECGQCKRDGKSCFCNG
ncbi:uncharacterized protein LOC143248143 [Tachypleus tridentatus]|uniref:uncharacterized protein LOC143248143 n=1 Tax=Tachypleus tridentatus TaxID=6853 RepID=UPI003FD13F48